MGKKDKNSRDPRVPAKEPRGPRGREFRRSIDRDGRVLLWKSGRVDREGRISVEPARSGIIGESAAGSPLRARYELLFFVSLKFTRRPIPLLSAFAVAVVARFAREYRHVFT